MGYQDRDRELVDYQLYELPGIRPYPNGGLFRGPAVTNNEYIACVGAAQTFGCLCENPFPQLLAESVGMATMNLGFGGAAPTFHNSNPKLLEYINNARIVIVQVLSGRSQSNSQFKIVGHAMEGIRLTDNKLMTSDEFFKELLNDRPEEFNKIINETRSNYIEDMIRLLQAIVPPKILFWFSVRSPTYDETNKNCIGDIFGEFPQLVNKSMIDSIRLHADAYVECVSKRGLPRLLINKAGNKMFIKHDYDLLQPNISFECIDNYYPSPEMHEDASNALTPICKRLLKLEQ